MDSSNIKDTILGSASPIRRTTSWIESFLDLTEGLPSPAIFRKWAAIGALAGAMERRVWSRVNKKILYPNIYMLLVGPPGVGKSVVLSEVETIWRAIEDFHVSPTSLTKASLVDALERAKRKIVRPAAVPPYVEFNTLLVLASEFGSFLPAYEVDFMTTLTKIYDCEFYDEERRTRDKKVKIENPQLTILGGTTPDYLTNLLPQGAWEQGFAARVLIIFSAETIIVDPFAEDKGVDTVIQKDLIHDMKSISNVYGRMEWEAETVEAFRNWHFLGGPPIPDHPKLINYVRRRSTHLAKLCMVASISESNRLIITKKHLQQALDWLIEAELYMPDLFKSMSIGGDSVAIEETFHFIWTVSKGGTKPVAEHRIVQYLSARVASHSVVRIIELMVRSRQIKGDAVNGYLPVPKTAQG